MTALLENIHVAIPEMIVLATACIALLADLFLRHRYKSISYFISCVGLVLAAVVSFLYIGMYKVITLNGLFISDDVANLMKFFIYISVLLSFIYSKNYIDERQMPSGDYYILGLFSTLGMMLLVSAHSLLTIFLGLELLSLPLYAMTAIRRTDSDASEAAMKYFVMGSIASAMLLYGISLIYGATGKLDLLEVANVIAANWQQQSTLLAFAMVFILCGVAFKLAAVPFHMWAPDVYQGAPTSVTLFISAAPKVAALGMAFRLLTIGLVDISAQWQQILLVITLLSTGLGNLFAVVQNSIKRLLAYSAISHIGYALFGILAATASGYSAALYYILVYAITSAAAFGLIVLMSNHGMEIDSVDDLKGLNKRNPWLAFLMLIIMFSLAGVPPTVGFFTKLLVLKALVDAQMTWVAVVGLFFTVIGAYYYLRIVKLMYFDKPAHADPVYMNKGNVFVLSLNCLSLIYLGIFPGALIVACMNAFGS
ncbi:NADH-quinone oxidoreductase subunit NuoN [Fluoribacter gormanii]|uniref:NADH-quinone oxidoreductase subunit N n=1 Tax=Fluoribacter gormanii TaxID=464 RepID=A0A377GFY3_9GAMM|nr:NADH-quinone oxidoreductase subunit NuoN [Fluoribacter gormanii]KTD04550.1 NADH dehydrogenase I chain N [Fluoribacter gormanii]MCW8444989.1 NADH-quinone oxidoreductase subunit NuoN [Fluoribacter gormanii]MCW8470199.1 NADH-quinone oxidoreductase subunit NuoN [Fluoribacter gormanii]SIR31371.1 NADH dehydrogenase subunit N [Fluoribacter gormanii]STO23445.1 NADH-quinone oxidoreductase subunit N [Fluoribacter gormanii]